MARLASVAAALALMLAACSTSSTGGAPGSGVFSITLSEFKYSPTQLQVPAGSPFKLTVKNAGAVEHDFTITAKSVNVLVKPGASAEREIAALEAGTYEIFCSIPGHKEAGMVGKLVVK